MTPMVAYDVALHIQEARGWTCRPQSFGGDQARLMLDDRWLGVTTSQGDVLVLLHAGRIVNGSPAVPEVESSAASSDMPALLAELDRLWLLLDSTDSGISGKSL